MALDLLDRRRMNNISLFDADEYAGDDNTEFYTPAALVQTLGEFDLDPCGARYSESHRLAHETYTLADGQDGLQLPWHGRVWLNPPYGDGIELWIRKAVDHGNVIALVPGRVSSCWFQDNIFNAADAVLFVRKRILFVRAREGASYRASFASIFVAYGPDNARSIKRAADENLIDGHFMQLRSIDDQI